MATNFDLSSSSGSALSSDSSWTDEETSAKRLDMSFHDLSTKHVESNLKELYPEESEAQRVEKLLLYNNKLDTVAPSILRMTNLTILDLSNNFLTSIPDELSSLTNLTQLFLRNNLLRDDSFPKSLRTLTKLRDLNLSGNQLTNIPSCILDITSIRNLFLGGNLLEFIAPAITSLKRLRVLYLGGNRLRMVTDQICKLTNLHALILCDNQLESLPDSICRLKRLECLQLHQNRLTTLPNGLIYLSSLSELSLRDNPLIVRFVRDMAFQPSSLLELAGRVITVHRIPFGEADLPATLRHYLRSSHRCVNPRCSGVYFNTRVEHIKFVDFCGRYKIPLMQYLCSPTCEAENPAVTKETIEEDRMKRVLLG